MNLQGKLLSWLQGLNRKKLNIFIFLYSSILLLLGNIGTDDMVKSLPILFLLIPPFLILSTITYMVQTPEDMKISGIKFMAVAFSIMAFVYFFVLLSKIS
jgi:hypothetical protein